MYNNDPSPKVFQTVDTERKLLMLILVLCLASCSHTQDERKVISTDQAPQAIGPYSQAILAGNTLYASGQIGLHPQTGELAGPDLDAQVVQTLENLKAVVEAAGMSFEHVVEVQVFLSDIRDFSRFNELYQDYFPSDPPARAVIEASALPLEAKVEIKLTAVRTDRVGR